MFEAASSPLSFEKIHLIHQAHSETQADIWLVRLASGESAVLRDYSGPRIWAARLLCRWALRREVKVHRILDGSPGIPKLLGVIDRDRYLMEWIEGTPLSGFKKTQLPESFFQDLEAALAAMHDRRVAHGDLRNKNIMVTPDQRPMVIDFSTAWWGTHWWRTPFFWFLRSLDRRRLAKSKSKFCPESLRPEEKQLLERDPWHLRLGRLYRHGLYARLRRREMRDSPPLE